MPYSDPAKERERKRLYRLKNKEKIAESGKRYRDLKPEDKVAISARQRAYRDANPERVALLILRCQQKKLGLPLTPLPPKVQRPLQTSEEYAERVKRNSAEYYAQHKKECAERCKKARAKNPKKYAVLGSAWKKANKDKVNTSTHKRRGIKKGLLLHHTTEEWVICKFEHSFACARCGKSEPHVTLCRDHIIPLSKGGPDTIDNIQPLCRSCNSTKARDIIRY